MTAAAKSLVLHHFHNEAHHAIVWMYVIGNACRAFILWKKVVDVAKLWTGGLNCKMPVKCFEAVEEIGRFVSTTHEVWETGIGFFIVNWAVCVHLLCLVCTSAVVLHRHHQNALWLHLPCCCTLHWSTPPEAVASRDFRIFRIFTASSCSCKKISHSNTVPSFHAHCVFTNIDLHRLCALHCTHCTLQKHILLFFFRFYSLAFFQGNMCCT